MMLPFFLMLSAALAAGPPANPPVVDEPAASAASDQDPAQEELLHAVLAQNTAAYNKIKNAKSFYVHFSVHRDGTYPPVDVPRGVILPGGRRISEVDIRVWQQDGLHYQDLDKRYFWPDTGEERDLGFLLVLNEKYYAYFQKAMQSCSLYRFENRQSLYPPVDGMISRPPEPSILGLGFMCVTKTPEQEYTESGINGHRRWHISREGKEDSPHFRIKVEDTRRKTPWLAEDFLIDGGKGFSIPEYQAFYRNGTVLWKRQIKLHEIQPGVWFPTAASEYREEDKETSEYTIHEVRLNEPIPASRFTLEAMQLNPNTVTVVEWSPGGRERTKRGYYGGEWIPFKLLPKEQQDALNAANRAGAEKMGGTARQFLKGEER